ncbi:MAG: DUF4339 domain-containing protein, partial [Bacteroidota bacterium]|nr:DUF4339 domain-containing protein [Bacteroidota bacterium]
MHYRLLRNNKESGPYTALQLQEMGLKPYDLLWADGRGAAWQYASELPELKPFAPVVEEQPFDRFFKKEEPNNTAKENVVAAKKTKPRFRISGDKIIMVEAGNMEVATNGSIQTATQSRFVKAPVEEKVAASPHWQEIYEEWQPQPHKTTARKEEPVEVETKYSESLDDLKKRYAEKVLNQKNEAPSSFKSVNLKQNIMAAAALLVLAVGGYIGYTLKQKDKAKTNASVVVEKADITGDNTLSSQQNADNNIGNNAQNNTAANNNVNQNNGKANAATPAIQNPVVKNKTENKTAINPSSKEELKKEAKTNEATHKPADKTVALNEKKKEILTTGSVIKTNKPAAQTDANATAKNTTGNNAATPPVATPVVKQNAAKRIEDYIAIKKMGGSGSTVENVRLLVNNITDFPIDLAVIDVQYFDSKGKFQKGETMYIKNIEGGNNVEVRVPD